MFKKWILCITIFIFQTLVYAGNNSFTPAFGVKSSDTYQYLSKVIKLKKNKHDYEKFDFYTSPSAPYSYNINIEIYFYIFEKQGKICKVFGMGDLNDKKIKDMFIKEYGQPIEINKEKLEWQLKDNTELKNITLLYYETKAIALSFDFKNINSCGENWTR